MINLSSIEYRMKLDIISVIMNEPIGQIVISSILGLGLASLFRKACTMRDCITIKGPNIQSIRDKTFQFDQKCYTYHPIAARCSA